MDATQSNSREDYWKEHVNAWEQSGLSGAKFCQANDLNYTRFVYWRRRLRKAGGKPSSQGKSRGFTQVIQQPMDQEELTLSLPSGLVLRGICSGNVAVVRELLELL